MAVSHENGWTSIERLEEPYNDALNYRSREQKEFFNRLFVRTDELRKCLAPAAYYLMGEKGTGKTAYAIYLENNSFDNTKCQVTTMTETQYRRFIELKNQGKLTYSDYSSVWRSILLYLVGRMIAKRTKGFISTIAKRFDKVESLVTEWEETSLTPELEVAFEAVRSIEAEGKANAPGLGSIGGSAKTKTSEKTPVIHQNLLRSENRFREAIAALNLPSDYVLFIDGIDYRPDSVAYNDYLQCVKGLGEAVWQLNTEFFSNLRDTRGRIKIVLLVRPDVFHKLNLYNSNSRLQDNAILLDWSTTEREFATSRLYEVSGRYFSTQQRFPVSDDESWQHYYEIQGSRCQVFRNLLKTTFQKPRDLLTFVKQTRALAIKNATGTHSSFPGTISQSPAITRQFADYLLGEVRNYATFYMPASDFENYLKFFQFLNGKIRFSMQEFAEAHDRFRSWASGESIKAKEYLRDPEALLQLYYDVNLIGYSESAESGGETFFHWSFREKTLNNIAPKVKAADALLLNAGVAKAIDVGKAFVATTGTVDERPSKRRRRPRRRR